MKKNTFSLLNTPWMIEDAHATSLIPHLVSMMKGNPIAEKETEIPVVYHNFEDDVDTETVEYDTTQQYIAVLAIKSTMFKYDQPCGPMGTRSMTRILKEWDANDNIIGVVLDIDSGGGQVSGLAEFAKYLNNYSKPLVAYTDGMMASAALYAGAACKGGIVMNEHADLVGSLGSMLKYVDFDGIIEAAGGKVKSIYATKSPRKNEEQRAMVDNNSDALLIKNIIDPAREQFASDMLAFRPSMAEEVYDGAIYKPAQALSLGIIDKVGTMKDAFDKIIELHNASRPKSNSKTTNTMSKQLPKVQAVLGLDAPMAYLEDKGCYLNSEQLDAVEAQLETLETSNATLTQNLADQKTELDGKVTVAENTVTGAEASVDAMLVEAGLEATGTFGEKLTALDAHLKVVNKKDGAEHTNVPVGTGNTGGKTNIVGGIDVSAALNN